MGSKLGIDFGTTNSSVALHYKEPISNKMVTSCFDLDWGSPMRECLQSVVALDDSGDIFFGRKAREQKAINHDSVEIISEMKTRLRKGTPEDFIKGSHTYSDLDLVGLLLRDLRSRISDTLEKNNASEIDGIVIGVPIECGEKYKRYLPQCLVTAGFFHDIDEAKAKVEFVSEPIAVALYYETQIDKPQTAFVFDFGGGTLDLTVMEIVKMGTRRELLPGEVLSKACMDLGGEILTKQFFLKGFLPKYGREKWLNILGIPRNTNDDELWSSMHNSVIGYRLIEELEKCKIVLSKENKTTISFLEGEHVINTELTREDFNKSIYNELQGIENAVNDCLRNGTKLLRPGDIDVVFMAGGSSLIPAIQDVLVNIFHGKVQIGTGHSMITSISRGLAISGYHDASARPHFLDIAECSYGIWLEEEKRVSIIVPRNTPVSDTRIDKIMKTGMNKRFQTVCPNPTFVKLKVYEVASQRTEEEIGCVESRLSGQDTFEVYFSLDNESGYGQLKINVFDCAVGEFMDDIPEEDRTFMIDKDLSY